MKSSFTVIIISVLLIGIGYAAESQERYSGPNLLRNNPSVEIYRENELGVPSFVKGSLSMPVNRDEQVATTIRFFEDNKGAYKMVEPSEELVLKKMETDNLGMNHIRFNQYYQGVRVLGCELVSHFTASGELRTVNGNYEAYIELDMNPVLADQEAVVIARDDLLENFGEGDPDQPELVVFPWQGTHFLCWRLFLFSVTPMGRWEYFVDASNGDIVFKANRIMETDAIGTGFGTMGGARNHIDTDFDGVSYRMMD